MKLNDSRAPRRVSGTMGFLVAALLLAATSPARAGVLVPELSLVGGTGVAGGTVSVTVELSGDVDNHAASADLNIVFPTDVLTFFPPVTQSCTIAERLADTYQVGGRVEGTDTVILSIFAQVGPEIPHLGNGPLASCDFQINAGVPAGTAAVTIADPALFDDMGEPIDFTTANGFVTIEEPGTPTATETPTILATATATNTGGGTPTNTPEVTPTNTGEVTPTDTPEGTPTNTGGPDTPTSTSTPVTPGATSTATVTGVVTAATATVTRTSPIGPTSTPFHVADSDSCSVVPIDHQSSGGMLALLLVPALLVFARRRRF